MKRSTLMMSAAAAMLPMTVPAAAAQAVQAPAAQQDGARWGHRFEGRWHGGWRAPGGWAAYRQPVRGFVVPRYWVAPGFVIADYARYALPAPPAGYRWYRYYDDAVLLDGEGRVFDSVSGVDWAAGNGYVDYAGAYRPELYDAQGRFVGDRPPQVAFAPRAEVVQPTRAPSPAPSPAKPGVAFAPRAEVVQPTAPAPRPSAPPAVAEAPPADTRGVTFAPPAEIAQPLPPSRLRRSTKAPVYAEAPREPAEPVYAEAPPPPRHGAPYAYEAAPARPHHDARADYHGHRGYVPNGEARHYGAPPPYGYSDSIQTVDVSGRRYDAHGAGAVRSEHHGLSTTHHYPDGTIVTVSPGYYAGGYWYPPTTTTTVRVSGCGRCR